MNAPFPIPDKFPDDAAFVEDEGDPIVSFGGSLFCVNGNGLLLKIPASAFGRGRVPERISEANWRARAERVKAFCAKCEASAER